MSVHLKALTQTDLGEFKSLLGSSEFGGCFCAVWSSYDNAWESRCKDASQPNFEITKRNVLEGQHVGYLVYQGDTLIGWTGSGPKSSFPFLKTKLGSRLSESPETTWSIGCLAIREKVRGKGLSDKIVLAVIEEAQKNGAKTIEAYPTCPWDEPRAFRGSQRLYERIGFKVVGIDKDEESEILLMEYGTIIKAFTLENVN
ncbi:MAG: GNAT family N-acetyltransferase [Bdellovibrionaceae bacterium]|nr:GNAT family N-acetyltransferase [Pseudobdellovibrionaceae bacterium]MCB9093220.1 GNAT family N-acetyltransferase [Halobacteriovoraceae bacterium]